jgi:hypothetical protein
MPSKKSTYLMSVCLSIYLSIHSATYLPTYLFMALESFVGPWPFFQVLNLFTHSVGLLGRGTSPSQDRYLNTGQHKHRIKAHRHSYLKWNRTHEPSVWAGEDGSCLRPRGHCYTALLHSRRMNYFGERNSETGGLYTFDGCTKQKCISRTVGK